ncbi:MAG: lipopolysaccharide biosynthesis protein [Hyphomonadaceae bacterium]
MSGGDPIFEPGAGSMQTHAVNGALAIGISQLIKLPFQAASLLLLPRLLQPIDYGIYAMIDPLVTVAALILNFGIGQALIQAPALRRADVGGVFWVMAISGCAAALLMFAASPLVTMFYDDPRAGMVAAASSLFLIIAGLTNVHEGLLNRQMRFGWIAIISAAGVAAGLIVSVIAALLGAGYWSLTLGYGATSLVQVAGVWLGVGWAPREKPEFSKVAGFYKFGGALMVGDGAIVIAREADSVLLGRYTGAAQLGFYDRANKLAITPVERINTLLQSLLLPILSRLAEEGERYRYAYLRVIRQLMLFTSPGIVAIGVTAPVLVPFLIGEQWAPAAPIFAWLTLAAIHRPVSLTMNLLFISQGRARAYLAWSIFSAAISVAAFVIGLRWGAIGVAAAFALNDLFVRLPALWWVVTRVGPIRMADLYIAAAPFAAGALACFAVVSGFQALPIQSDFVRLALSAVLAYATAWATAALFRTGRKTMADSIQLMRTELPRLLRRRGGASAS